MKKRVVGIGGIFFKSKNPSELKTWYSKHLGIETDKYGGKFVWRPAEGEDDLRTTVWSPMPEDTTYYAPSGSSYMINYRVENLIELLRILKQEGVEQVGEMETYEYGKFAWILDPDGTKIELWEPKDEFLFHEDPMNKAE